MSTQPDWEMLSQRHAPGLVGRAREAFESGGILLLSVPELEMATGVGRDAVTSLLDALAASGHLKKDTRLVCSACGSPLPDDADDLVECPSCAFFLSDWESAVRTYVEFYEGNNGEDDRDRFEEGCQTENHRHV